LRYHPYEQPFTISTANDASKSKWSFNPFSAYDDSSDDDDKPEVNLVDEFMNDTKPSKSSAQCLHKEGNDDEQVSVNEKGSAVQRESAETANDFFNLKSSKRTSLLSIIQGYREEDVDDDTETNVHHDSATSPREVVGTTSHSRPSPGPQAVNYNNTSIPGYVLKLPEHRPLEWNAANRGFVKRTSSLSTYKW